jgi:hypothetical protein
MDVWEVTSGMTSDSPRIVMTATLLETDLHGILMVSTETRRILMDDLETDSTETNPSLGTRTRPMQPPRLLLNRPPSPPPTSVSVLTARKAGEIAMLLTIHLMIAIATTTIVRTIDAGDGIITSELSVSLNG